MKISQTITSAFLAFILALDSFIISPDNSRMSLSNTTQQSQLDFNVELYIADLWVDENSDEALCFDNFQANLRRSPEFERTSYMIEDSSFVIGFEAWKTLHDLFTEGISGIDDLSNMISGNNKALYFELLLGFLQQIYYETEPSYSESLQNVLTVSNNAKLVTDIIEKYAKSTHNIHMTQELKDELFNAAHTSGDLVDLVSWVTSFSVSLNDVIEYTKVYDQIRILGERAERYLHILKNYSSGSTGLSEAIDELLLVFSDWKNPSYYDIQLGFTVYDIFFDGICKLCKSAFPEYASFITPLSDTLLFYRLGIAVFNLFTNSDGLSESANILMVMTYLQSNISAAFTAAKIAYSKEKSIENARALFFAADMLFTASNGGALSLQGYRVACRKATLPIVCDDITISEAQNIEEFAISTNVRIKDTQNSKNFVYSNWREVLKKQNQEVYCYIFGIPNFLDPRGDDGAVNWNLIIPVRHRNTVPAGWKGIYTAQDLDGIRNDLYGRYILMNDIDLVDWGNWLPIGDGDLVDAGVTNFNDFNAKKILRGFGYFEGFDNPHFVQPQSNPDTWEYDPSCLYVIQNRFCGYFQGNGYRISNLTIQDSNYGKNYAGLFGLLDRPMVTLGSGYTEIPRIANLQLENINIQIGHNTSGYLGNSGFYIGGIAGYLSDNDFIKNCSVTSGSVNVSSDKQCCQGGLVGYNRNSPYVWMEYCYNAADLTFSNSNSSGYIGGLVGGQSAINMRMCFNVGDISLKCKNYYLGSSQLAFRYYSSGIATGIAFLSNTSMEYCMNFGNIKSEGRDVKSTGMYAQIIKNCANLGDIIAIGDFDPQIQGLYSSREYAVGHSSGIGDTGGYFGNTIVSFSYNSGYLYSEYEV